MSSKKLLGLFALLSVLFICCAPKMEHCGDKYDQKWQKQDGSLVYSQVAIDGEFVGIDTNCELYDLNMMRPWGLIGGQQVRFVDVRVWPDSVWLCYAIGIQDTVKLMRHE
jgi:hypothetical protein